MKEALFVGVLCLAVSIGFLLTGCGAGEPEAEAGTQTTCPVLGNPIDKSLYEDYQGKRVYLCCKRCPKKFKADPDKYIKKMADEGVVLEDTPK